MLLALEPLLHPVRKPREMDSIARSTHAPGMRRRRGMKRPASIQNVIAFTTRDGEGASRRAVTGGVTVTLAVVACPFSTAGAAEQL